MALNQNIFSPLTNIQGSISSFTHPLGNTLQIISSSLPAYQSTGWQYKISTTTFTTTSTSSQNINDLQLTLANSKKYTINGYILGSSANVGYRLGVATGSAEAYYAIEVPTSTSGIAYGFNSTPLNANGWPSANLTNYYYVQIRAIVITAAAGVATFTPTLASAIALNTVAAGPSVIYYREY